MNPKQQEELFAELESLGLAKVKERIATGHYTDPYRTVAKGWVKRKEAASSAEQLALARQARRDTQWANRIAIVAVIIAAISFIVAVVK